MERDATTTAARAMIIRHWLSATDRARMADAVVDAVRPLIIAEEHDRLRNLIEALHGHCPDFVEDWSGWEKAIERVLALLGESTKEEA